MSTSKLQRRISGLLSLHLGQYTIRENIRPEWLIAPNGNRLELDFYIEELKTAIEVQGKQHYIYVSHFHKDEKIFQQQIEYDRLKRERCVSRGIYLIEVDNEQDFLIELEKLIDVHTEPEPQPWSTMMPPIDEAIKDELIYRTGSLFGMYPRAIRRHLKRLGKILEKYQSIEDVTEKSLKRIRISLDAMERHQIQKGQVEFNHSGLNIVTVAKRVLEEKNDTEDSCKMVRNLSKERDRCSRF